MKIPDDGSVADVRVTEDVDIHALKLTYQDAGASPANSTVMSRRKLLSAMGIAGAAAAVAGMGLNGFAGTASAKPSNGDGNKHKGGSSVESILDWQSPGTHVVSENITVETALCLPEGSILKPASGVIIKLQKPPIAGAYQIFDYSSGGVVQFIGNGTVEVYAEWWGAKSDGIKTNNEIPLQQAADAVQSVFETAPFMRGTDGNNNGGIVKLAFAGTYLVSGNVNVLNRVVFRGQGTYTEIKANPATWSGSTMFTFKNGTNPQFFCRMEMLNLHANNVNAISRVIYAPAWQESCGLRDVVIISYRNVGLYLDQGYGGSVGCVLRDVQFFASPDAVDPYGIYADFSTYMVAWYNLVLDGASIFCASNDGSKGFCIYAKGRMRVDVRHTHIGEAAHGIYLDGSALLVGTTLGADHHTTNLISYTPAWTGYIDVHAVRKGFANNLLRRTDGAWTLHKDFEPIFGRLHYPHNPGDVHACCYVSNGGTTPVLNNAKGISSVTKVSSGLYEITFDVNTFSASAGTAYRAKVRADSIAGRTWYIHGATATKVLVQFKDLVGAVADCSDFYVEITGNTGV